MWDKLKALLEKWFKKWFSYKLKYKRKKIVTVYSADTNKIDKDGGPYEVEVKEYD